MSIHRAAAFACAFVLPFLSPGGCAAPGPPERPSILLVTFDTLRADHIGCYGYERIKTPVIDSLATSGLLFEKAITPIPVTLPSHTSIMTGLYPHQHGVRDNGVYIVPEGVRTLAEMLHDAGYETAGFVGAHVLERCYRIDQGFDVYGDAMEDPLRTDLPTPAPGEAPDRTRRWMEIMKKPFQRRGEVVVGEALGWLAGRDPSCPFFCWVHLFDPHLSYRPPAPWKSLYTTVYDGVVDGTGASFREAVAEAGGEKRRADVRRMVALYDGEISYADYCLGRLLKEIPEGTLVVFTADHGEALGEHGQYFEHGRSLFGENVHVPLVLAGPWVERPGEQRADLVSTIDIVPTVLAYLRLPEDEDLPGRSLLEKPAPSDEERAIYMETMCSRSVVPTPHAYKGVRTDEERFVVTIEKRTYTEAGEDLYVKEGTSAAPVEAKSTEPRLTAKMRAELAELEDLGTVDERNPPNFWDLSDDKEREEQLRSLGYVK